jgi:uncharacterized protein YdeI (YjbR/CyaY-like superfamily)
MPKSFRTQKDFRAWLEKNHASTKEMILRLFKVHAKARGIGYREALDEALCFGWIDGVRRGRDADSFTQRFTPRKKKSNWSLVNIKRVRELESEGKMHAAGLAAFNARDKIAVAPYSFENRHVQLDAASAKKFRANKKAWASFQKQPPWYRRTSVFYVMSAKREETRAKRLAYLIERSSKEKSLPQLARP